MPDTKYPVELTPPDIEPYRAGNTGIEYVTTFTAAAPGPHVMVCALTHGNEICGAIAIDKLFRAGIRPTIAAQRLSQPRLARMLQAVRETLQDAIAKGGSTLRDYVDSRGEPGYFQLEYFVYGREGLPCRVCGTAIKSLRQGARATFYCPRCQR